LIATASTEHGQRLIDLRNIAGLFEKAFSLCYDPPHGCIHHGKAR
jgi:hypothetical protein